jgi:MerR family transcriptional regulator, redox-sensitive transcriptional activator SoxR
MPQYSISEMARQVGLRASAVRYYESVGLLPSPRREHGQRRYDQSSLYRLAVVQRARQAGFSLEEIRTLFQGFETGVSAGTRWHQLAEHKLAELEVLSARIRTMQDLLRRIQARCHCVTLEECGKAIFPNGVSAPRPPPVRLPGLPTRAAASRER